MSEKYDLIVIGSGPGGYVAAVRASQLGLKTAIIEKDKLGGVCGNWGCIPSKALIHQADTWHSLDLLKAMGVSFDTSGFDYAKVYEKSRAAAERSGKGVGYLLKKNKVEVIPGIAKMTGPQEVTVDGKNPLTSKAILIATGSAPRSLPGFEFDEKLVLSSTGLLAMNNLPKSLIILGSGAIGMELAYVMRTFGVEVTIVEMMNRILPLEDPETASVVEKSFVKQGVKFLTKAKATTLKKSTYGVEVTIEKGDQPPEVLKAEKLLVAVGRVPNTEGLGLDAVGIKLERGFIAVQDYMLTSCPSIYAIGDVVASPLLAHVASKEGEIAVEHLAAQIKGTALPHEKNVDPLLIPGATYCEPQIASFGWNEEKAKEKNISYKTYSFPYMAIGKASAIEKTEGLAKLLYDPTTKEILGAHIVGAQATELIHELLLAKQAELLPEDIASMIHAHPTLSEGIMEAARGVENWAIHV